MNPKLYDRVAFTRDITDHGLKQGDVATVVDFVPHPNGAADGMVLEIANALGESLRAAIGTAADIEPLMPTRSVRRPGN